MRSDLYRLVTVTDGKNDTDAIVGLFAEMAAGRLQPDLTLLNYYHELPVHLSAPDRDHPGDQGRAY